MEAATAGTVRAVAVSASDAVQAGDVLLLIDEDEVVAGAGVADAVPAVAGMAAKDRAGRAEPEWEREPDRTVRPELAELKVRIAGTLDAGRPAATERRHAGGRRTARENIQDLCDPDSF
jgi:multidrug resistance efflux pump